MSLTGALNNAFSGLKANSRAAQLVSTNIANSTTESYGRRELALSGAARGTAGGVRIDGVVRHSDPVLLSDRRENDASLAYAGDMYAHAKSLETMVGDSTASGSLVSRVTAFENALLSAASNPASTQRLENVAETASLLTRSLNDLSGELQLSRQSADKAIGQQVDSLNTALIKIDDLNNDIVRASATNEDVSTLLDERQRVIDSVSDIVPLRIVERDRGEVAVFTTNGAALLDGKPVEIGFTPVNAVDPDMSMAAGDLNGLTVNGFPVNSKSNGMFAGGSLAAQFEIRDETAVESQAQLDAIARDLIERLGAGGPDTTLAAGDPGLFTDGGAAFDPLNEVGIAGRIELNAQVTPGSADIWKLRDGLGAAVQGEVGDSTLLQGVLSSLNTISVPGSTSLPNVARTFVDHISQFSSNAAGNRVRAENEQSFLAAQHTALTELEYAQGVDTDAELQNLMLIEQSYSANARVMTVVDELMERLLAI